MNEPERGCYAPASCSCSNEKTKGALQLVCRSRMPGSTASAAAGGVPADSSATAVAHRESAAPVSYTHLTLPTILRV